MRLALLAASALTLAATGAFAQSQISPACRPDADGRVDFQACADAAPVGSPERGLSLINLATLAFLAQDYAKAVQLYDEAVPPGQKLYSDIRLHAYRGAAYFRVGRTDEAAADARVVLRLLSGERLPGFPAQQPPYDPVEVLGRVLEILKQVEDPGYPAALARFRALPARDWVDHANRAGALAQLEDFEGALLSNAEALRAAPDHPQVLNNACYLLASMARAVEGLPYCERAVAAAPEVAAIRHSYATALAGAGQCARAHAELAEARRLDPVSVVFRSRIACTPR